MFFNIFLPDSSGEPVRALGGPPGGRRARGHQHAHRHPEAGGRGGPRVPRWPPRGPGGGPTDSTGAEAERRSDRLLNRYG